DAPVTRAQFAAMINKAFNRSAIRQAANFADVPANYWGYEAIQKAYTTGFLAGYPNNRFAPNQNIPRAQVLVSLANGLNLAATSDTIAFQDASDIPAYARSSIAAATANRLVVNYPNVNVLNPNQIATRADVAAFIYQALVSAGQLAQLPATDLASQYIVGYQPPVVVNPTPTPTPTPPPVAEIPADELTALQDRIGTLENLRFRQIFLSSPSYSGGSPSGFGLNFGDAFLGVGGVERTRFTQTADAGISAGFGLGDSARYLGLEIVPTISSLTGDDAFQAGSVDFKVHRLLGPNLSIAGGIENLVQFGNQDIDPSGYGVISKIFNLRPSTASAFSRLYTSVGAGGGRFRSEDDIDNGNDTINVFGTVGVRVLEPVSAFADWTGQDLNVGLSLSPFRQIPLVITPSLQDVTGTAGDGSRFALSLGYSLSF
ncbi:MAG: S-layer homology domain-containing protein, partial [Crinalium sp.]